MIVFETERLRLRHFAESDAAFLVALLNDPAWLANIGDRGVRTEDDARAYIAEKFVAAYARDGHGFWAVETRAGGVLVGGAGLLKRPTLDAIDVGYAFLAAHRGLGYARESARACLAFARTTLAADRVLAIVLPSNARSVAVLTSIGMTLEDTRALEPGGDVLAVYATRVNDERARAFRAR